MGGTLSEVDMLRQISEEQEGELQVLSNALADARNHVSDCEARWKKQNIKAAEARARYVIARDREAV